MAAVDRVSQQTGRPCVALTPFPAFLSLHSVVSCHQSRAKGLSGTPDKAPVIMAPQIIHLGGGN